VISTLGGIVTVYTVPWWSARIFRDHRFERMIMLFGVSTGTLSTGLALLRIVDPEFKTKVSRDYMLASGLTFLLAIPFILSINLPAKASQTGSLVPFWTMIGISAGYLIYCIVSYMLVAREKSFKNPGKLWID
ncbi:MAG TPA: sodium:glutamate symporter, partial [Spirochaetales bacterium]|nr:sodium:glutamate symporter [Spirochaetales bacterium]